MSLLTAHSGAAIDLLAPDPSVIRLRDISVQLSRIARFNGATTMFYSVAQHSVLVARIAARLRASPRDQFIALMHDAHEAYIGDITRPVAVALGSSAEAVDAIRLRMDRAIFAAFGISFDQLPNVVRLADDMALATEWRDLMPGRSPLRIETAPWPVKPKRPDMAEIEFLGAFHALARAAGLGLGVTALEALAPPRTGTSHQRRST